MPYIAPPIRYDPGGDVSLVGGNSADTSTKTPFAQGGHQYSRLTSVFHPGDNSPTEVHHQPATGPQQRPPDFQQKNEQRHEQQYGWSGGYPSSSAEHGGAEFGRQGYSHRANSPRARGERGGAVQGTGRSYESQRPLAICPATQANQPFFYAELERYRQYADPPVQYQDHRALPCHGHPAQKSRLTRQRATAFDPNASAFTPSNTDLPTFAPINANVPVQAPIDVPQSTASQHLRSVSSAQLIENYRVNKQRRYDAAQQQRGPLSKTQARSLDPSLFNPAYAVQRRQNFLPLPRPTEPQSLTEALGRIMPALSQRERELANKQAAVKTTSQFTPLKGAPGTPNKTGVFDPRLFDRSLLVKNAPTTPKRRLHSPGVDVPLRTPPQSAKVPLCEPTTRPKPTASYLRRADAESCTLAAPRQLLVILDLNGTLLHRKGKGGSTFAARPHVEDFLDYLFTHHKVMVWSSARPENVANMCKKLFTPEQQEKLVGIWARDKLRLSDNQYREKVQVYKQLSWVWQDPIVAATSPNAADQWNQHNTILVDDSVEKAASEPFNIVQIDEFEDTKEQKKVDVLGQVVEYLDVLRWQSNVSTCMRKQPFYFIKSAAA